MNFLVFLNIFINNHVFLYITIAKQWVHSSVEPLLCDHPFSTHVWSQGSFMSSLFTNLILVSDCPTLIWGINKWGLRARLHQASASTLRQLCNDACNSVLIENNGVAPEWGCNLFSSDSTDLMRTESQPSSQSCCSVDADAWCKHALTKEVQLEFDLR